MIRLISLVKTQILINLFESLPHQRKIQVILLDFSCQNTKFNKLVLYVKVRHVECLKSQTFSNSGAKTAMISVPSRRNLRSESVGKCSTCQSFTRTESPSCRIGTLVKWVKIWFVVSELVVRSGEQNCQWINAFQWNRR